SGNLRRRRDAALPLPEVVDRPDDEHHRRRQHEAERLGGAVEHLRELRDLGRHRHRHEEPAEHGGAAERRGGPFMDAAALGDGDGADAGGDPPHDGRRQERGGGAGRQDDRGARHESGPPAHVPASSGYGVYFEQRRAAASRTSPATVSSPALRSTVAIRLAISPISGSLMPAVVTAAVPSRSPLVTNGFSGSFGIAFLLTVIPARSSASWATLPVTPKGRRSTSMRWLSVPPDTIRNPSPSRPAASARALRTIPAA